MPKLKPFERILLRFQSRALIELSLDDLEWAREYWAIKPLHDQFGLEVWGIQYWDDAVRIEQILNDLFPELKHSGISEGNFPTNTLRVRVYRDDLTK